MVLGDFLREKIFQTSVEERPGSAAQLGEEDVVTRFGLEAGTSVTHVAIPAPGPTPHHIGAWYLEPAQGTPQPDQARAQAVLYVHGVKGNRSRGYRVGLYNVLLKLGLKVDMIQSF